MSRRAVQSLSHCLRQVSDQAALEADAHLLRQFVDANDHQAFEVLLERHGPMVLGTARRLVNNAADAADVFQAVFLSLARLAKSIRQGQSVANWLYTTTCRIAARARKRRGVSIEDAPEPSTASTAETDLVWREVRTALDEELQRLPERLRLPLLLCYLSGLTRDEAAEQLGWSISTLKRRLEEGRTALRKRLERRGISAAGLALAVLSPSALDAAVCPTLAKACLDAVFGKEVADGVSALILTTTTTIKGIAMKAVIVSLALVGLGVGTHASSGRADPYKPVDEKKAEEPKATAKRVDPPAETKPADKPASNDLEVLKGTWNIDSMEWGGKSLPKDQMTGYKFVFDGNKLTWNGATGVMSRMGKITAIGDAVYDCEFKIDPTKGPKEIDITKQSKKGSSPPRILRGIYEIKGDTLKVCYFPIDNGKRPTEFVSKEGANIGLIVLTRAKGAGSSAPAEPPASKDGPLGMKFVPLPKGTFYMGWDGKKKGVKTDIKEDFEIAIHTVTQEQWEKVMGNNPSFFSRDGKGKDKVKDIKDEDLKLFPVESVSWDDMKKFIKKLNEKEAKGGYVYRLPTEAEWEYACRGGATSEEECSFHFYFDKPTNDLSPKQANFKIEWSNIKGEKGPSLEYPIKVGLYPPNKLGLYDMHGNVWQRCEMVRVSPTAAELPMRGGSYGNGSSGCTAAYHGRGGPGGSAGVGLRLVRVPSGDK